VRTDDDIGEAVVVEIAGGGHRVAGNSVRRGAVDDEPQVAERGEVNRWADGRQQAAVLQRLHAELCR
jgi:hypothetical protein